VSAKVGDGRLDNKDSRVSNAGLYTYGGTGNDGWAFKL
jgi:hypothetical protein